MCERAHAHTNTSFARDDAKPGRPAKPNLHLEPGMEGGLLALEEAGPVSWLQNPSGVPPPMAGSHISHTYANAHQVNVKATQCPQAAELQQPGQWRVQELCCHHSNHSCHAAMEGRRFHCWHSIDPEINATGAEKLLVLLYLSTAQRGCCHG